jgi:hypothetical protein
MIGASTTVVSFMEDLGSSFADSLAFPVVQEAIIKVITGKKKSFRMV